MARTPDLELCGGCGSPLQHGVIRCRTCGAPLVGDDAETVLGLSVEESEDSVGVTFRLDELERDD